MRPRLTVRRLMAIVSLVALALALGIPAVEVYRARDYHVHTGIDMRGTPSLGTFGGIEAPFWPRYVRRLLGRPWRMQPLCGPTPGIEAELCELAHPEIAMKVGGRVAYRFTGEQGRRMREIGGQRARGK